MFCQNCGKELNAAANFCPGCGTPVGTMPLAPAAQGAAKDTAVYVLTATMTAVANIAMTRSDK